MLKFHPCKGRLVEGILLIVYVSGAMCNFLQIYAQFIFEFHYCIKSVSQAFNSHVSTSTNPCTSKAINVLLMTGPHSTVGNVSSYRWGSDCKSRGREFDPALSHTFMEIYHGD